MDNPVSQSIWLMALLLTIVAFVSKKDNIFLIFMILASFLWWIHFMLLSLLPAAFINFFDTFKNYLAYKYKQNKTFFIFLLISYIVIGFLTVDLNNYLSFIPIFNSILSVFLIFYFKWIKLKIWFIFIVSMWFIYNYFWNSIAWMLSDMILFVSGWLWVYKIYKSKKRLDSLI